MCRSSLYEFKRSLSSPPPPTHVQHSQPPSYRNYQSCSVKGAVALLEAQPTTSMAPIIVQRLTALLNSVGSGDGASSSGVAVDATTPKDSSPSSS
ncbi:unnamed protein product [Rotaria sp. Silwood2]|nr:unnamed protein product [Rotaria sp. Silwood2]CAF2920350.1 unnamed protein product [Rotaria sp. Silwood2]CAF3050355.1 unnamed protein product [Rotaria sp. Silwood2]CAF3197217.1 unnamed protein product [Rotaria sp. Silwood2]CAF4397931.1 unnamed protein product [Rotaria sp. Silwood2]